jgi:CRISPR-associated endonuclease/helicase Cas3
MTVSKLPSFAEFFRALHGHAPYAWQASLAAKAARGEWPGAIDLPTSSGKTACIDVAVYALACQAVLPVAERHAPRRIVFCVNRRVIVDEAFQRAKRIAKRLWEARPNTGDASLSLVADALREVSGISAKSGLPPLDVLELRGGIYRDNRWARSAAQPTVICTTVDQLGSRLLFRGYGVSPQAAPIQAALLAYDSLVLLDEAHISRPFQETLEWVGRYLDPEAWAEASIGVSPMRVVPMTATPAKEVPDDKVLRLTQEDRANPALQNRLAASKPATLRGVSDVGKAIVAEAKKWADGERPVAVGVIVNRVKTARKIYEQLRDAFKEEIEVELVIGSMRPIDRDLQSGRLAASVGPERPAQTTKTRFVVATQCLECGADYDFDVLLTECASLDALRQRFGRLNRAGRPIEAQAVIFIAEKDAKSNESLDDDKPLDPIYGNAMARTWNWLGEVATVTARFEGAAKGDRGKGKPKTDSGETRVVDFGVDPFSRFLEERTGGQRVPEELFSPSSRMSAPVMFPAYVDFWCPGQPDVQVCWRVDLVKGEEAEWCDTVALVPPTSAECVSLAIGKVRDWLMGSDASSMDLGDVLDGPLPEKEGRSADATGFVKKGVLWRGASKSVVLASPSDLRPGDTLVLPTTVDDWKALGYIPENKSALDANGPRPDLDLAELASHAACGKRVLRLHPSRFRIQDSQTSFRALFKRLADPETWPARDELKDLLAEAAEELPEEMQFLKDMFEHFAQARPNEFLIDPDPDKKGVVLTAKRRDTSDLWQLPALDDGDDAPSRLGQEVTLRDHTTHVRQALKRTLEVIATTIDPKLFDLSAERHDWGKADDRFQAMLRGTDRTDPYFYMGADSALLAKSGAASQRERSRSGLPKGFRHEMLSVQLAERAALPVESHERALTLHLIAAHHGQARPFAPCVIDEDPPEVWHEGIVLTKVDRTDRPPHRLDSGIADRFWTLTRRYGWWGLAYLEALLRLADQQASADEAAGRVIETSWVELLASKPPAKSKPTRHPEVRPVNRHVLSGIDGSNPLAFLAALGTLRLSTIASKSKTQPKDPIQASMSWACQGGQWTPTLFSRQTKDELLNQIHESLACLLEQQPFAGDSPRCLGSKIIFTKQEYRQHAVAANSSATSSSRQRSDWLAALATEFVLTKKSEDCLKTSLDFTSGQQQFLQMVRSVVTKTSPVHMSRCLFNLWRYEDECESLRWDPIDDRRYALCAYDPSNKSKNPIMTELGANALAFASLPLLPIIEGRSLTLSPRGKAMRWVIWSGQLTLETVQSLLASSQIRGVSLDSHALRSLGIDSVLESEVVLPNGYYRNFTPSRCLA